MDHYRVRCVMATPFLRLIFASHSPLFASHPSLIAVAILVELVRPLSPYIFRCTDAHSDFY